MSQDNFEDALECLRRDKRSFIVIERRKIVDPDKSKMGIIYSVDGELHNPPCPDEWEAMLEAVRGFVQDKMDGA